MTDADLPPMVKATMIAPVTLAVTCPACGAEEDIDALTGLEERDDGSFMPTYSAVIPCDCGVLIEVSSIVVEFKR